MSRSVRRFMSVSCAATGSMAAQVLNLSIWLSQRLAQIVDGTLAFKVFCKAVSSVMRSESRNSVSAIASPDDR